jgi:hypothetical protein
VFIDTSFELIFCGSLLTHRYSYTLLRENAKHYGLEEHEVPGMLAAFRATGFGYRDYPGQTDYGVSIAAPAWVLAQLRQDPHLKLVYLSEMGWDQHQDAVACVRVKEPLGPEGGAFIF